MTSERASAGRPGPDERKAARPRFAPDSPSALLALQRAVGNAAVGNALREPLDPALRARLEPRFGVELSQVRVRRDATATLRAGGIASTVGDEITVDPDRYRPGSVAGDVLMAHEVAHTVQQRGADTSAATGDDHAIEADADRAALSVVSDRPPGFLTTLRSALTLRRCKGCTREEEEWLTRFQAEREGERLADVLRPLTTEQLDRIAQATGGDQLHTDAVAWERAWRSKQYAELSRLGRAGDQGLRRAYGRRLVDAVLSPGLSMRVTGDPAFQTLIRNALTELAETPRGLILLCDLLATGKPVTLAPAAAAAGHETRPTDAAAARLATQVTDEQDPNIGSPLPPAQQRRGAGSGSTVMIDTSTLDNEVTLGGTPAHPAAIAMDATDAVGHELIHALHNALGVNIATGNRRLSGLADPLTGQPESPEELYTITGQKKFDPVSGLAAADLSFPTEYAVPTTVTENDLRKDRGRPERGSHFGAVASVRIPRAGSTTLDALAARYALTSAPVPPAGLAVIRAMLAAQGLLSDELLSRLPADARLPVPDPQHVLMRIRFVDRQPALADRMEGLTVR